MSLLLRINLWLCGVFLLFTLSAVILMRAVLHDDAREDAIGDARLLMAAAQGARDYTEREVSPALERAAVRSLTAANPVALSLREDPNAFLAQSIPAYAANQVFAAMHEKVPAYSYRELALNPTNPRDRAQYWEADVIQYFRTTPQASELIKERVGEFGKSLYLAKPTRIDNAACLACHSTPSAAPAAMLRQYGSANGFGWQLHEVIGAQIVSVPLEAAEAGANRAIWRMVGAMTGLFVLTFLVVNLIIRRVVLRRLIALGTAARDISTGRPTQVKLDTSGGDEIAELCRSFERMQTSVDKSLALLARNGG